MPRKYTLVGVEQIPPTAIGPQDEFLCLDRPLEPDPDDLRKFQDRILAATWVEMLENKSDEERDPSAFVEFVTMDEYRASIGAYQFGVETETF